VFGLIDEAKPRAEAIDGASPAMGDGKSMLAARMLGTPARMRDACGSARLRRVLLFVGRERNRLSASGGPCQSRW